uniref:DUF7745 domain-containing protein n=1 Tax=Fagus sylvatica TaxID=28930 RepID=A0A2N9FKT6_FAGSY
MASSSGNSDSLVTLRFHDFRVERMRHWWTLLGEDDHADIVGFFGQFPSLMRLRVDHGLLEALASFWDPTHCCFSIGEVDLVPTLEEYAGLLQLGSPFSETPVIPIQSPRSNRVLEKYLGLTSAVLRSEIIRPEETWWKANISLDLLVKYFSRSDFPVEFARDFIAGKKGWKKFRINAFKIAFAGIFLFPTSAGRIDLGERRGEGVPMFCTQLLQLWFCSHLQHFYRLQTPYHFERHTVSQTVKIVLPFTGNSRDWALYLLDLPLSLALRQFGGVQYPPRLGDLDAVTFDYIPGEDMWRLLSRIEVIWEGRLSEVVLIEDGSPGDSSVTSDFVEWREGWTPSFTLRPTVRPGASYSLVSRSLRVSAPTGQSERTVVLERELEEARAELASLRLARASEREEFVARVESMRSTLYHNSAAVANLRRDLEALVDPATGRPHDIVALRWALDESEAALTSTRTSIGAMWVQISVLQALHQINQVMDSLGARARAVLEEHDKGDPALSTALGRFCRETCIRLGH